MDCIICAYPIDNQQRLLCLTPCNHNEHHVCSVCFLRMRSLQRNLQCPTCKRELEHVICTFTEEVTIAVQSYNNNSSSGNNSSIGVVTTTTNANPNNAEKGRRNGKKDKEKEGHVSIATSASVNTAPITAIVITPKPSFDSYEIWGEKINEAHYIYDNRSQMFVPKFYFDEFISKLWEFKCRICQGRRKDFKELRGHYFGEHKMQMCQLCIDSKQVFPSEQQVYTQQEYERHLRCGDADGSKGHPYCEFCRTRFYDSTPLFLHLTRDHFSCHLCSSAGIKFKYYNKYKDLESHFRKDHYICEEVGCLERGFMAFANEIDLMTHRLQYHPHLNSNRCIPIQFKYKNNGNNKNIANNAEANNNNANTEPTEPSHVSRTARFEGGLGGRAANGEWQVEIEGIILDPRDPNRNILREDPAVMAMMPTPPPPTEDFPQLPSSTPSSLLVNSKWINLKEKKSKQNAFPALPVQPKKPKAIVVPRKQVPVLKGPEPDYLEDYAAISGSGSKPVTVVDSLGTWANIKVDKRSQKKKTGSAPVLTESKPTDMTSHDEFSIELQHALTESLKEAPAPSNRHQKAEDEYPTLLAESSTGSNKVIKPKIPNQKKAVPSSDWGDALKAAGMQATKKKSGITVIKAQTAAADKKLVAVRSFDNLASWGSTSVTPPPPPPPPTAAEVNAQKNSAPPPGLTANTSSKNDESFSIHKHAGWVQLGGSSEKVQVILQERVLADFPSLSQSSNKK